MIRLARHIEILLLGNDCVIVPGLGGFVVHHLCARYDVRDGLFLPPLRTLGFNPVLKMNDSLLAQSYVEAYDLSYPEAVETIENEVREMLGIMQNSGSYVLNGLGKLFYNKDGKLNFEPFESGILSPEFYALSSFSMPMLTAAKSNVSVPAATAEETADDHETSVVYIGTEHGRKTLNISLKAIRNVGVAAAIAVAAFLVGLPFINGNYKLATGNIESGFYEMFMPQHNTEEKSKAPAPIKLSSPKAPAAAPAPATSQAEADNNANVEKAAADKGNTDETSADADNGKSYWSIVVCTHITKKNAAVLADKLHAQGFTDAHTSTTGATKVLMGHFATKDEAHKRLNQLVDNEMFKDAWLLEVK